MTKKDPMLLGGIFATGALLGIALTILAAILVRETLPSPFDSTGDDAIDYREFRIALASIFSVVDRDLDGRLSKAEYDAAVKRVSANDFRVLGATIRFFKSDRDGNKYLTRDEVLSEAAMRQAFQSHDRNGDGKIDRGESPAALNDYLFPD